LPAALAGRSPGEDRRWQRTLVVVDYAHTPDALESALLALRPVAIARGAGLTVIFGCGGDRDRGKRPLMGDVAVRHADRVVLTSDNPRSEDPQAILDDIRVAATGVEIIADRAEAIRRTILLAHPADVVLIAGKGHESYQEIAGVRRPFSDAGEARAALAARQEMAMMMDLLAAARATAARLIGDNVTFCGVSTDSRSIAAGELFVALRGENFDGHEYVAAAQMRGAVAAIVAADAADGPARAALPLLQVAETRLSLGALAADWRSRFTLP
jgi:murE/murF fusion protein